MDFGKPLNRPRRSIHLMLVQVKGNLLSGTESTLYMLYLVFLAVCFGMYGFFASVS